MNKLEEAAGLLLKHESPDLENEVVMVSVTVGGNTFLLLRCPGAAEPHVHHALTEWTQDTGRMLSPLSKITHLRWRAPKTTRIVKDGTK